ncbi:hypothetical protein [Streptomyces cyaneofuscatus]|uniref:hypothetical protein n=1 Tax=Streptomyces cyaneofuscatus TaxID=66883 RepID=UPI003659E84C
MAARKVVLFGDPLMSLPLNRRIAFAISDPGAITPRGDDYREPVHVWQARAIEFVLPNVAELESLAEKAAQFCAERAGYVSNLRSFVEGGEHDYYRWTGHAEARRQLAQSLGLPVAWPAEDQTALAVGDDSYEAPVPRYLSVPYADSGPRPASSPELLAMVAAGWNSLYAVGAPVVAYPGCRPEDDPKAERLVTRTRSKAEVLGGHTAVVWVDGHSAAINLTHVDPCPAEATS